MLSPEDLARLERTLAERAALADIRSGAVAVHSSNQPTWYDVRPMLDPQEHSGHALDLAGEALRYAQARGLITHHPHRPYLVRVLREAC